MRRLFLCMVFGVLVLHGYCGAEIFSGTNAPGTATDFSFTIGSGVTNFTLSVSNSASAFSHLLLKYGGTPSDTNYDFIATNAINLELPECRATNYGLRVRTPTNSLTNSFTVTLSTNVPGIRSSSLPVVKPQAFTANGALTDGQWHYFRVEIPANSPGWRLVLNSTNASSSSLYVRKDDLPTTSVYFKRVTGQANGTIILTGTEATNGTWFVGVYQPGGTNSYTLFSEVGYLTTLNWDPGTTHLGTEVFTNSSLTNSTLTGGDYYFKINAENTDIGVWRTALNVTTGEADIYMQNSWQPNIASEWQSRRTGSDGFVLHSSQYTAGQDWYILVHASPGAQWNLVSGKAYVKDLGSLTNDVSSSNSIPLGAEGMCFFKTTVPAETLAWRLGLNGLNNTIYVKKSAAPHPASYDLKQDRQMLVVPDYLGGGSFNGSYFVGIQGNPGDSIALDSRRHAVTNLAFSSSTNLTVTGSGYTTYRVQVPVSQLVWQVKLSPGIGDPNLAVRREKVPNEWNNDAFSEVAGLANDSITIVPSTLSDGTFYITVYGIGAHSFTLTSSGNPVITDIDFTSNTVNTETNLVGWRYYRLLSTNQLGQLGWDLLLTNQVPGTEIALRTNAIPGRWNYRINGALKTGGHVDYSGIGFLQRPGHQADIWYVGVYMPTNVLGSFSLITRPLVPDPLAFNGTATGTETNIVNQPAGKWQYFTIEVPTNATGWDIRLKDVISGNPQLVVSRDQLPTTTLTSGLWNYPCTNKIWPSGYQWVAGTDWTGRDNDSTGKTNQYGQILAMGMGNPLEPGTYYAGVSGTSAMSYTLWSRGIGTNLAIPVIDVSFTNGSAMTSNMVPREAAYYRVVVPSNTPSWQVRLSPTLGEALLKVQWQALPCIQDDSRKTPYAYGGQKMQKADKEQWMLLPENGTNIIRSGTYYFVAVSEGQISTNISNIGTNLCSWTFESFGVMAVSNVGTVGSTDLVVSNEWVEGGSAKAYQFTVPAGILCVETWLEDRTGNPIMKLMQGQRLPSIRSSPYSYDYGNYGGLVSAASDINLITTPNPTSGVYSLIVGAGANGGIFSNANYSIRVQAVFPTNIAFDGGSSTVTNQSPGRWQFFRIDVPTNATGWDIRLKDVISGDPHLVVCRSQLPVDLSTRTTNGSWGYPYSSTNWPIGSQWLADSDWTGRAYDSTGTTNQDGRILAMGMGNPLEPGTYYAGVLNGSSSGSGTNAMSYTLWSRGIGTNFAIPVIDVTSSGTTTNDMAPREAAYYRVVVLSNTPSFRVQLSPTLGEALLKVQWQALPCIQGFSSSPYNNGGQKMQKAGKEHWILLPENSTNVIRAGTYYFAAVSEGQNPVSSDRIGTNLCSWAFESFGVMDVINLGEVGATDLVVSNEWMEGGSAKAYQFTIPPDALSFETRLENRIGNPIMKLIQGQRLPGIDKYSSSYYRDEYGNYGGVTPAAGDFNLITTPNPISGVYSLIVNASDTDERHGYNSGIFSNAIYSIRLHAVFPTNIAFDGGSSTVTNQSPGSWQFFRIDVPTNATGWDIRLKDVISGDPHLVVCRGQLPVDLNGSLYNRTNWPSGYQWAADLDWTGRAYDSTGTTNQDGRILAMGMGNPLEPGKYYAGVLNGSSSGSGTNAMSYTLWSRGIGTNLVIPVIDVSFANGNAMTSNMVPREAAYYRVVVLSNTPSWQVRMSPTLGEALLKVQWQALPCIQDDPRKTPYAYGGQKTQKADKEQWVLLPEDGTNVIRAGTYYFAAVSEGQNPVSSDRIGTGLCSWTFESFGVMAVSNLGTVGATDLVVSNALEGGAAKAYQFTVPAGTLVVETRLENRTGNPVMSLIQGQELPKNPYVYGNYGGVASATTNMNVITTPNPTSGVYSLIVGAGANGGTYGDASYTLRVRYPVPVDLNFSGNLNTNGQTNVVSGTLADNQRAFFKVVVPATNNGQSVVGWRLDLSQSQGAVTARVRKNLLPADSSAGTTPFSESSLLIVPPFLTPGTWWVEVRGAGATSFTLTSRMFELERPVWNMPLAGQPVTTPGLTAPEFGDTGIDTNGLPLPGDADRGVDLGNGMLHYYAVNVSSNNAVLIRTMLEAISGNPDLYIRAGLPPTLSHNASGNDGVIYERSCTGAGTEYGNWVPHDGKSESFLTNGVWYFAVRAADNANARYRLHISSGSITNLALNGGSLTNQILAGGDWRYYRVEVPTNAPAHWNVTFGQQQGDVLMYVRDTVPAGNNVYGHSGSSSYADWAHDYKNDGPYANYDAAGTYDLTTPPLRPGQTYYLGFRAVNDATFSLSSSTSGGPFAVPIVVPFSGATNSVTIPANTTTVFRLDVPTNAAWLAIANTHSSAVRLYMEQGTLPYLDSTADWTSGTKSNTSQQWNLMDSSWPWLPGYSYYLVATNTSSSPVEFTITTRGALNESDVALTALAGPSPCTLGRPVTVTLSVRNNGPESTASVVITNVLPSGATLVSATATTGTCSGVNPVVYTVSGLSSGATAQVEIRMLCNTTGVFTNVATMTSVKTDPVLANNTATSLFTVVQGSGSSNALVRTIDFLQLGLCNADVVVNRPFNVDYDRWQDTIESSYALVTETAATNLTTVGGLPALPDNAFFASDTNHPFDVTLSWHNDDNGPNALRMTNTGVFAFSVSAGSYERVDLFATSGDNDSHLTATLQYGSGSDTIISNIVADNWSDDASSLATQPAGVVRYYLTDGLDYVNVNASALLPRNDQAIFGLSLPVDASRSLTNVVIAKTNATSVFCGFGAVARLPLDSDADGMPDWWESKYFNNPTNANSVAICSNGFNTVGQAYIAGLNPNDPQSAFRVFVSPDGKIISWSAIPERFYFVYFSTNLMNGFQLLKGNILWPQSSFTNSSGSPKGFYKIEVRMELWQQPDPDTDADGIPDSWELQYFGGPTNANPTDICSNGYNTVFDAYIAGLDPKDPQSTLRVSVLCPPSSEKVLSWNSVSGRVYSVYFSSNLMNGFPPQPLAPDIPWPQSSYTYVTNAPQGFYQIKVRLAE